jgi:CubicO group peptidase (beta-lactamase class C family)
MVKLMHEPDERCLYSNMGVALLGQALAHRANKEYESLLLERICRPLGLTSTKITLDESMRQRLAVPFDADQNRLKNWDLSSFSPAGAIKSTADDLLTYVSAELGLTHTDLAAAIDLTQTRHREFNEGNDIALNWLINKRDGHYWHNGQTGGYHSAIVFDRKRKLGVVVLTNTNSGVGDDVAEQLLQQMLGKPVEPPKLLQAIALDPALLDRYVGSYKLGLLSWLTIAREENHLTARLTGQPAFRIYPLSETEFFWKVVNARVTFDIDDGGKVTSLVLHQFGTELKGPRT